jgi:serine/threonine protein kinase
MEYMPGGNMWEKICWEGCLSEDLARFYGAELTLAVEHLHTKGIVHR